MNMKKYLKELEIAGIILIGIGVILAHTVGYNYGMWPCGAGMLVLLIPYLYKAFHWKEYEQENRRNIWIILICILFIYIQLLILKR
jgi:hypothetical protein